VLGLLLIACGSIEITAFPSSVNFGDIDFHQAKPSGGYNPTELALTNTGDKDVELEVMTFDFEHLCLEGYDSVPTSLNTLSSGATFTLLVSVCDYIEEAGERDDLLTGSIDIDYGKSTVSVPWSFTPILNISDTGN
jgi:hypothetical protein